MAGSYHAGTATLDVLPSLKGFHTKIRSELKGVNPNVAVQVKPDMSGFQRQMKANLPKASTIQVKIEADKAALKKAESDVVGAEKRMAAARESSSDSAARLDIAEKQLAETRSKAGAKASAIAAAELKVAQAKRASAAASNDASNAEAALTAARRAVKDAQIKLKADVDTLPAQGTLRAFAAKAGRAYALKVGVDADTTGARATLEAFSITAKRLASVTGNVSLDTGAAMTKLTLLSAKGAAVGGALAGGIGLAGAAIVALPALVGSVLGPVAALTVGLNGVGDALKAFSDADDQAAANATSNAQQQVAAARQIASAASQVQQAKTGLARAEQDAGWAAAAAEKQVQQALKGVTQAEKEELQAAKQKLDADKQLARAQDDLNTAYEDARRSLRDLGFQVRDGAIAEKQAVLDLATAQEQLDAARAAGLTGADLEKWQLAYDKQELTLEEIQANNKDLAADQAKATKAGVDGSAQVVAAQDRVASATDAVANAQDGVAAAQQGVLDAVSGVADARAAADQQAIQSQRSIDDATQAVAQAQLQLSQAIQDAGTVGAGSVDKINAAIAKLSPNAQQFVRTIQALKPEFSALKNEVQDALFANLGPEFSAFAQQVLPQMAANLVIVAGAMNGVAIETLRFLATGPVMAQFQQFFAALGPVISAIAPVLQILLTLFLQLATAAMPGIVQLVQAIGTIGTALLTALQPLINSGAIATAVGFIAQVIAGLAPILGQIVALGVQLINILGPSLVAIIGALAPVFGVLGQVLLAVAPVVGQIAQMIAAALLPVVQALAPVISALLPVIQTLIGAALQILVPLIQAVAQVFLALMPAVNGVLGALMPLVPMVTGLITAVAPLIAQLLTQLAPILTQIAQILVAWLGAAIQNLMTLLPPLFAAFSSILGVLSPLFPLLVQIANQLFAALMPAVAALAPIFTTLIQALLPILPPLVNLVMTLLPILVSIITTLMPLITFLANVFAGVLGVVLSTIVVPIINLVVNAVKILADIFGFMWGVVQPIWRAFGQAAQWAYDNMLKPAFDAIHTAVDAVGGWFQKMGDTVGGIWDGLKKLVHGGIQGIVDLVYNNGIRALANAVIKYIPGVDYLPELKVPEFASGGQISGPGTGTSDSIPALLSNGEFVMNAGATKQWLWLLEALNAGHFARGGLVGFADGGAVTTAAAPAAPAAGTPTPVTIDPTALAALGDVAATATEQITALATSITTLLMPSLQQLILTNQATIVSEQQLTTTFVYSADTMNNRQLLLQQQFAVSWAAIVANTWASVNGQTQALAALDAGLAAARAAMTQTADWATGEFGRMRAAAADPVRWVLQFPFNAGLIAAWNRLDADFALGKQIAPVAIPFATGGRVTGAGTGTSDSISARLSAGEFVVREAIAKRIYPFLTALNAGQAEALQATGYATGGIVADTGGQLNATVARGLAFAKAQDGKPYVWGASGPDGFDCSGLMSALTNVLRGDPNPYHRLGVAASVPWPGFTPGLTSAFAMGASSSHTAGTLAGVNVESTGTHVRFGGDAHGADDRQFPVHASLPVVGGQFVPGGGGFDPAAIVGPYFADTYRMIGQVATLFAANHMAEQAAGIATQATDRVRGKGVDALNALLSVTAAAGSPEVVAAVRAVANRYGWGVGPQWDALNWIIGTESSWDPNAANRNSSARGLFQKMTSIHGPLEPTITGQAECGLNYIAHNGNFHDPIGAKLFHLAHGWYHTGGWVPGQRGTDVPAVLTPGERVLSVAETRSLDSFIAGAGANLTQADTGTALGPMELSGALYLDSGEFLGMVRGEIQQANDGLGTAISRGVRG